MLSAPALGDDIKSAVKEFGLVGAWSSDCSGASRRITRITFAAPFVGGATATSIDEQDGVSITTVYEIPKSVLFTSDKIGIALHPVAVTHSDGETGHQQEYSNLHLVFQKVGERIQIVRVQYEGLPEIEWSKFFEKCAK